MLSMRQPSTFIMPISRVRSYMLIIMVFIMPMAATSSDTPPMAPKRYCICAICCSACSRESCRLLVPYPMASMASFTDATESVLSHLTRTLL